MDSHDQLVVKAINACGDGILIFATEEASYQITFANPAMEKLLEINREEWMGKSFLQLVTEKGNAAELKSLQNALTSNRAEKVVFCVFHKEDVQTFCQLHLSPIKNSNNLPEGFIAIFMEISHNKMMSDRLAYLATHDALTDLPNQTLVIDRIDQAIIRSQRYDFLVAVLYIDIDHIQSINEKYGNDIGDLVLQEVGIRLAKNVRETDAIARVSQDEFVVALPMLSKEEECFTIVKQIMNYLKLPIKIDEKELNISCCIGISFYPYQGMDAELLLKNARSGLIHAKAKGPDSWHVYTDDMMLKLHDK